MASLSPAWIWPRILNSSACATWDKLVTLRNYLFRSSGSLVTSPASVIHGIRGAAGPCRASPGFRSRLMPTPGIAAKSSLFDHLVGGHEQAGRHGEAERLRGFEVELERIWSAAETEDRRLFLREECGRRNRPIVERGRCDRPRRTPDLQSSQRQGPNISPVNGAARPER
jgi:hypothetical protein